LEFTPTGDILQFGERFGEAFVPESSIGLFKISCWILYGVQIMSAAKNKIRLTISLLLVPFLFLVVTSHVPANVPETGLSHKATQFTPAISGSTISFFTVDRRTNSNSLDGLFKYTLIIGQISPNFTRELSSLLGEYTTSSGHCADRAAISIRAPPFF